MKYDVIIFGSATLDVLYGAAPSDLPEFALFLVKKGIESISITPDTVLKTILELAKRENDSWPLFLERDLFKNKESDIMKNRS